MSMKWSMLILVLSLCYSLEVNAGVRDSLRLEFQNGKALVFHQVEAKETLFSLSRRYHTSVAAIQKLNNLQNNDLALGSILKIPFGNTIKHQVSAGETLYSVAQKFKVSTQQLKSWNHLATDQVSIGTVLYVGMDKPQPTNDPSSTMAVSSTSRSAYHVVTAKETLYSIAQKYQLTVVELQQMNGLEGYNVGIGDTLSLASKASMKSKTAAVNVVQTSEQPEDSQEEVEASPLPVTKNTGPVKAVKEKGIASVFPDNNTKKYLALHRSAPVGTIMQVRNEMTNLTVFVRVVGRLPNTGENTNVLLKLSQAAQQGLGALDNRFRVEISYIPAK